MQYEELEGTENVGACKFCGQIKYIKMLPEYTKEDLDEIATCQCNCEDSRKYSFNKYRKTKAHEAVDEKFDEEIATDDQRELLKSLVDDIVDETIIKASLTLEAGIKASLSLTSKGLISIKRTVTTESSTSV